MALSKAVVQRIRNDFTPPGRFLKKDSETGQWVELTLKEATGKTAQAFAYAIRDRAKQNKEEEQKARPEELATKVLSGTKRPASPAASLDVVTEGHSSTSASTRNHDERGEKASKRRTPQNNKSMASSADHQIPAPLRQQQPQPQLPQASAATQPQSPQASAATLANSDAALSILAQLRSPPQQQNGSLPNVLALQQLLQQQQVQQQQAQLAQAILTAQQQAQGWQASQSLIPPIQGAHSADEMLLRRMLIEGNPLALSQHELQLQGLLLQSNPLALSAEQLQLQGLLRNSLQNQSILSLGGGFNNQQQLLPQVQPNLQQLALTQQVNTIVEFLRRQQDGNGEQNNT